MGAAANLAEKPIPKVRDNPAAGRLLVIMAITSQLKELDRLQDHA